MFKQPEKHSEISVLFRAGGFLRLKQILQPEGPLPISRSSWWEGIRMRRYPQPVKLGPRITAWRCEDIQDLLKKCADGHLFNDRAISGKETD